VVPDPELLAIPANLQLFGDAFGGDRVATCQAPSLGWLAYVHGQREVRPAWKASVWALKGDTTNWLAPLSIGVETLEEELGPYASIHRDVTLPEVASTTATWILGHGGLGLDRRHFARLSDELGATYQSDELVSACRGAALVVLLVCSGGRTTKDMFTDRMRGLPYQLLRSGARAVIASPWPLDVRVAVRWSRAFVHEMVKGSPVAAATFEANRTLKDWPPRDRLAMHLYGDPWLAFECAQPKVDT
jgi:hypothetical protein